MLIQNFVLAQGQARSRKDLDLVQPPIAPRPKMK